MVIAWCELRQDFRNFRTDRISELAAQSERYPGRRNVLMKQWREQEERAKATCENVVSKT